VEKKPENSIIIGSLLLAVLLWGANNAGTKFLVRSWPPIFVGSTRFFLAGLVLLALFRWTNIFPKPKPISAKLRKQLWLHGGLSLALYIVAFNWAVKLASVSHVALYLGASPVWALLWEGKPEKSWRSAQRYGAALLALLGVFILFLPVLKTGSSKMLGEVLSLGASVLWTAYGRQCRALTTEMSGAEISAHTFLRAAIMAAPFALFEVAAQPIPIRTDLILVQTFCVLGSGVVAFALWNNALRHWKTSQVYLFNNLIPLSTMTWAYILLHEEITHTFWIAMLFIVAGVVLGQANWQKIFGTRWFPE
jgi:drug/metabolite transporter (DMT)-like permease